MLSPGPRFPRPAARSLLPAPCSHLSGLGPRVSGLGSRPSGLGSGVWGLGLESAVWAGSRSASGSAESALGLSGLAPLHPAVGPLLLVFDSRLPVNGPCSKSLVLVDRFRLRACDSRLEPLAATPRKGEPAPTGRTPDLSRLQTSPQSDDRRRSQHPHTDVMPGRGPRSTQTGGPPGRRFIIRARTRSRRGPCLRPREPTPRTLDRDALPSQLPCERARRIRRVSEPLNASPVRVRSSPVKPQRPPAPLVLELFHVKQPRHPEGSSRRRAPRSSTSANSCSRR